MRVGSRLKADNESVREVQALVAVLGRDTLATRRVARWALGLSGLSLGLEVLRWLLG